jgi:hypothetical protein
VTTKPRGGVARVVSSLRSAMSEDARGLEEDIVVQDGSRGQEMYREGPFDNVTVRRPFQRITTAIAAEGSESFMRRRRIENAQPGPVDASSGRST